MKENQDAFGRQLFDYYTRKTGIRIIPGVWERSDGYIDDTGSMANYFGNHKNWTSHEKKAIRFARGRILDIGTGAGKHALYLQEKGHDVVGLDNSPLALEVCRQRGLKNTVLKPFSEIDLSLGIFNTVLMMGNNFGLFGSVKGAKRLLKKLHGITSNQGRIIAESATVTQTVNPDNISYQEWNKNHNRMPGQIKMRIRYMKTATPWFDYLRVSKEEMESILEGTGWKVVRFFDSKGISYAVIIEKEKNRK